MQSIIVVYANRPANEACEVNHTGNVSRKISNHTANGNNRRPTLWPECKSWKVTIWENSPYWCWSPGKVILLVSAQICAMLEIAQCCNPWTTIKSTWSPKSPSFSSMIEVFWLEFIMNWVSPWGLVRTLTQPSWNHQRQGDGGEISHTWQPYVPKIC